MCTAAPWSGVKMCWPMKVPFFDKRLQRAVEQHMAVGKLAAALGGEGEERPGAAFDVDPAVLARRAGLVVELVQFLLARHDREAERFDDPRPLVEGQLAQSAGPPTSRAWGSMPPKSIPPLPVIATGAPSIALESSARLPSPAIQRSRA